MKNLFLKTSIVVLATATLAGCVEDEVIYTDANPTRVYTTGVAPGGYYTTSQTPPAPRVMSSARINNSYYTAQTPSAPASVYRAAPAPSATYGTSATPAAPVAAPVVASNKASKAVDPTPVAPSESPTTVASSTTPVAPPE